MKIYIYDKSPYSQKVLCAARFLKINVEIINIDLFNSQEYLKHYRKLPWGKVPILVHESKTIYESTSIVEYLALNSIIADVLIPSSVIDAFNARHGDRVIDNYMTLYLSNLYHEKLKQFVPSQQIVEKSREELQITYQRLERNFELTPWLSGENLTFADCSAVCSLELAHVLYPFNKFERLMDYWEQARKHEYFRPITNLYNFLRQKK